ncbi:MAG: transporter ATP-binding protein, partial [Polyangiaceae bacterium]|nr:transporter ATP-binding protein [Polyangiaceae bacterium]
DEIRALCHHCTVLRGGKVTGEVADPAAESNASLSRLMIGAEPPPLVHHVRAPGELALQVNDLSLQQSHELSTTLCDVSLEVHAGEVLGVAGVSGNGQGELLAALSGEDRRAAAGTVRLFGQDISSASPAERRKLGLHFVPEERLGRATVPVHSLADNVLLTRRDAVGSGPILRRAPLRRLAQSIIERFDVKARSPDAPARSLSGGNLQKYVVGREIAASPKLLIVSQPTWGVDVGASAQIRAELLALRDTGTALLLVSEDLDELLELSDALVVMAGGRLSPRLARNEATRGLIGEWMSGLWPESGSAPAQKPAKGSGIAEAFASP